MKAPIGVLTPVTIIASLAIVLVLHLVEAFEGCVSPFWASPTARRLLPGRSSGNIRDLCESDLPAGRALGGHFVALLHRRLDVAHLRLDHRIPALETLLSQLLGQPAERLRISSSAHRV